MERDNNVKPIDLLDVLLDADNKDPIVLLDEKGRQLTFEQVAVIPYGADDDKKLYCVLKPVDKLEGIADDEAIVFVVHDDANGNTVLKVEDNEEVAIAVFDKYYDLLEEAQNANKEKKAKSSTASKVAKAGEKKPAKTTKTAGKTVGKTAGKVASKAETKAPAKKTTKK